MMPFNQKCWHAGTSRWNGTIGLNSHSIGIELDNAGKLKKHGNNWIAEFGKTYLTEEVLEATHKHEEVETGWHLFTEQQITVCTNISTLLCRNYGLREVLGHDDIAPHRKVDPGPAFPMASFRSRVIGRKDMDLMLYQTTTNLNIREGAGTQYRTLIDAPLPQGTRVDILSTYKLWRFVNVEDEVQGISDLQGWVHSHYLTDISSE